MNPLTTNISIIQKAVSWFALQINWLVSIWWEHRSLKGRWCDDMNRYKGYEQSILCKYCSGKISFTKLNIFRAKMKNSLTLQLLLQIYWMFVFPCSRPFACPQAWSPIGIYRSSPSICIYRPWSTILLPVRGLIFCIYRPCLLNLCLYLRSWPTICIIGPGPEFTFTLLLVVVAVVAVIVVVVISLE